MARTDNMGPQWEPRRKKSAGTIDTVERQLRFRKSMETQNSWSPKYQREFDCWIRFPCCPLEWIGRDVAIDISLERNTPSSWDRDEDLRGVCRCCPWCTNHLHESNIARPPLFEVERAGMFEALAARSDQGWWSEINQRPFRLHTSGNRLLNCILMRVRWKIWTEG